MVNVRSRVHLPDRGRLDRASTHHDTPGRLRYPGGSPRRHPDSPHDDDPALFIAKWKRSNLSEMSAYQQHFLDLCDVLGEKKPADVDPDGTWYTFQKGVTTTEDTKGWADVWLRNCFGLEYKGKHKDLKAAYQQLLKYREALENPPLLIVCDLDRFEIHTNFTGTSGM